MIITIQYTFSDLPTSNNGKHGEPSDVNKPAQSMVSNDEEPGWVIGTYTKIEQQALQRFLQMQMKLDKLSDPG